MDDPWSDTGLGQAPEWTVEAHLERIHRQRVESVNQRASEEAQESQLLAALMPASAVFAELLRDIERRSRKVRSHRRHEVTVFLRQPTAECIRASLRWGTKFALSEAERALMRNYRTRRRRLQRYPDVVIAHHYFEVWGTFNGTTKVLELGTGHAWSIAQFQQNPALVRPFLDQAVAAPTLRVQRHHKASGYEAVPSG